MTVSGLFYSLALANTLNPGAIVFVGDVDPLLYITLGTALATNKGYTNIALVAQSPSTHYPPGFPALLALVIRVWPSFPENALALGSVGLISAAIMLPLCYALLRRAHEDVRPEIAVWAIGLTALSPYTIAYAAQFVLTEMPYLMLTVIAMLLLTLAIKQNLKGRRYIRLVPGALAIGAAYYVRTVGLALAIAAIGYMLWDRRFREATVVTVVFGLTVLPWALYNVFAGHSPFFSDYSQAFMWRQFARPELGQIGGWEEIPLRVVNNLLGHIHTSLPWVFLPSFRPNGFLARLAARSELSIEAIVGFAILVTIIVGYASRVRSRLSILEFYVPLYIGLILLPPWVTDRNLVPVLPFLFFYVLVGIDRLVRPLGTLWGKRATRFAVLGFLIIALVTARHNLVLAMEQRAGRSPEMAQDVQVQPLIDWIQVNTAPDDVFLSGHPYALYLYAHRRGAFVDYSPDPMALLQRILASGAGYIVPSAEGRIAGSRMTMGEAVYIQPLLDAHPDLFTVAYESRTNPQIRVYEISR